MRHLLVLSSCFVVSLLSACATGGTDPQDAPIGGLAGSSGAGLAGGQGGASGKSGSSGASPSGGQAGQSGQGGTGGASGGQAGTGGASGSAGDGGTAGASGGQAGQSGAGAGGTPSGGQAGQAGAGGAAAGASGAGAGGAPAGGQGGQSGAGQAGGGAGGAGAGGAGAGGAGAGGAGASGASGSSGSSGQAGSSGSEPTLVVLAGSTGNTALVGAFTAKAGWTGEALSGTKITGRPALAATDGVAYAVAARLEDAVYLESGTWSGGTFSGLKKVGAGYLIDKGPAVDVGPLAGWVTYQRAGKHHAVSLLAGVFGSEGPLGSDSPQAFSPEPSTVSVSGKTALAVYAGQDEGLYTLEHDGQGWGKSTPVTGAGTKNFVTPVVVRDDLGQPTVFFARNSDSALCVTTRTGAGWSAPQALPSALVSSSPSAVLLSSGALLVAWHGLNQDEQIFVAHRPKGGVWSAPVTVEGQKTGAASRPVVTDGATGADGEVVYIKSGKLRHARFSAGAVTAPKDVASPVSELVDLGATLVR